MGGAVRDKQLGLEPAERDWVVVGSTPEQMLEAGYQQVGKDFPVFLHPQTHEEYALARTERKTAPGYTGFEFHASADVTLEEDLYRRDLTINAMAEDSQGNLIDPYHGLDDLNAGLLRHISPAFSEDPVRILRIARFAARFAQWGFRIAHGTHKLMRDMVTNGEVDALIPERVWSETEKALSTTRPWRYFEVLHNCGALARIFPEIDAAFSHVITAHQTDNETASIMRALREACELTENKTIRFAAMCWNIGNPSASTHTGDNDIETTVQKIKELCQRLRVPNEYRDLAITTAKHAPCVLTDEPLTTQKLLQILIDTDAFRRAQRFENFLIACEAVYNSKAPQESTDFKTAGILQQAFEACQQVSTLELQAAGLSGQQFAAALNRLRIQAIAEVVAQQ